MARGFDVEPMGGAREDPKLDLSARRVCESAGVEDRHHLVVGAVDQEDRLQDLADQGERSHLAQLPRPGVQTGGNPGRGSSAARAWATNRRASTDRSAKSAGAENAATPRIRGSSPAAHNASALPAANPHTQTPSTPGVCSSAAGGRMQVGQPAAEREVPRRAGRTTEAEGEYHPADVGCQAVGKLVVAPVGMGRDTGLDRKAVAEDQAMPTGSAGGRRGGPSQVGGQRHPAGFDRKGPRSLRDAHRPTLAQQGRLEATLSLHFTGVQNFRLGIGGDHAPDRYIPGNWCGLTRWSSGPSSDQPPPRSHIVDRSAGPPPFLGAEMLPTPRGKSNAFPGQNVETVRSRCAEREAHGDRSGRRTGAPSSWPA